MLRNGHRPIHSVRARVVLLRLRVGVPLALASALFAGGASAVMVIEPVTPTLSERLATILDPATPDEQRCAIVEPGVAHVPIGFLESALPVMGRCRPEALRFATARVRIPRLPREERIAELRRLAGLQPEPVAAWAIGELLQEGDLGSRDLLLAALAAGQPDPVRACAYGSEGVIPAGDWLDDWLDIASRGLEAMPAALRHESPCLAHRAVGWLRRSDTPEARTVLLQFLEELTALCVVAPDHSERTMLHVRWQGVVSEAADALSETVDVSWDVYRCFEIGSSCGPTPRIAPRRGSDPTPKP